MASLGGRHPSGDICLIIGDGVNRNHRVDVRVGLCCKEEVQGELLLGGLEQALPVAAPFVGGDLEEGYFQPGPPPSGLGVGSVGAEWPSAKKPFSDSWTPA